MNKVTGDPILAKTMRDAGVRAPIERIIDTDWFIMIFNHNKLRRGERVVDLACGHQTVTRNRTRAACEACHEMILNGEDYDAFRNRRQV